MKDGYAVVTAGSGEQGLRLAHEIQPAVITMDVMMPSMDGWSVSEAGNGQEALDIMGTSQPHLILLDLMMPVMDGFDFLTAMRAQPEWQHIPVIVVTAKNLTEEDHERLNGMVEDVVEKSAYTREQLLEHVSEAVAACNISETGTNTTGKNHE